MSPLLEMVVFRIEPNRVDTVVSQQDAALLFEPR